MKLIYLILHFYSVIRGKIQCDLLNVLKQVRIFSIYCLTVSEITDERARSKLGKYKNAAVAVDGTPCAKIAK